MARDMSVAFAEACNAYIAQQEALLTGPLAVGALPANTVMSLRAQLDQIHAEMRGTGQKLHEATAARP